jgi:dsDNA-binding SOS-regulon protein
MRTAIRAFLLLSILIGTGQAATRSDINTIEAAEKIRYLSQKIAKSYLYLYSRPQHSEIKNKISDMVEDLGNNFSIIASSTDDDNTKDLLKYLEYNKNNIKTLLSQKVSKKNSALILDYSEILLEGGESIAREHSYSFNKEETMLMNIKKYEFLTERLGKFYMASSLGALSQTNRKKMEETKKTLEHGLKTILAYKYPTQLEKQKKELNLFWSTNKHILAHAYDMFIPNLMDVSNNYFEHLLAGFALYHSKKQ